MLILSFVKINVELFSIYENKGAELEIYSIFLIGLGLAIFLSFIFGEKYSAGIGALTFGGTLAALYIFLLIADQFLLQTETNGAVADAEINMMTFNIKCDENLDGQKNTRLAASIPWKGADEDLLKKVIKKHFPNNTGATYIPSNKNPYKHIKEFRQRHILVNQQGESGILEIPGKIRIFSVFNVIGLIAEADPNPNSLRARKLFDVRYLPTSDDNQIDIEIIFDLTKNSVKENADLYCDLRR